VIIPESVIAIMEEADRMGGKPTLDESRALVERYLKGDKRAWEEFSIRNSKMVVACVVKWCRSGAVSTPFEDLFQAGMTGLLHSMGRIKLEKIPGNPTTYCFSFVYAEIRRSAARDLTNGAAKAHVFLSAWESGDKDFAKELAKSVTPLPLVDSDVNMRDDNDAHYPTYLFDIMDRMDAAMLQMTEDGNDDMIRVLAMRYGLWGGEAHSYPKIGSVLGVSANAAKDLVEKATLELQRVMSL
jgi:DNA-directed RNA polymerase sigma subunit (sigma70/sigma32)